MSEEKRFLVDMELLEGFRFNLDFHLEGVDPFIMDEPPPLGKGSGPNASLVLASAIGNCLSASLLFCLQRSRVQVSGLKTSVKGLIGRNPKGRWRIKEITVDIEPKISVEDSKQFERCTQIFEDFCVVTESVRQGIPVKVNVKK
ncbi:OsmC family protein [Candidatus Bathyarchaeota archaeon]|nr:OsmC family protein [Candidatus Bathyarchaeota archaeon]